MRSVRIFALVSGLLLAGVPAASAAVTVSSSGGLISVQGDDAPFTDLVVTINGANFRFTGATAAVAPCVGAGPVDCPMAGVTSITAALADGADTWDSNGINVPTTVDLGNAFFFPVDQRARTGNAADTIIGGRDRESDIVTNAGNDTIRLLGGSDGTQAGVFGPGIGSILGGPGDDVIDMGEGNDGDFLGDWIDGGPGNDTVDLGPGNDKNVAEQTFPNGGNDTVLGGAGDDQDVFAGDGDDVVDGGSGNDQSLFGSEGTDTIRGGPDQDSLETEFDDFGDTIEGNSGDDTLTVAEGPVGFPFPSNTDLLSGGTGRDTAAATAGTQSGVIFTADGVADDGYANAPTRTANVGTDIEVLSGTQSNDALTGGPGVIDIRGFAGDDTLTAGPAPTTLNAGSGADLLNGGPLDDLLLGGQGADTLGGNDGNDMLNGGNDGDAISGGNGRDTGDWSGAASPVTLNPGDGAPDGETNEGDELAGDVENLLGSAFNDTITGAPGPSLLSSGGGDDNVIATDDAADVVVCGAGDDGVSADPEDTVEDDGTERCERVSSAATLLTLAPKGKVKNKKAKVLVACPPADPDGCFGEVRLTDRKGQPISRTARFGVNPGGIATVALRLTGDALKALEKKNKLKATILAELEVEPDLFKRISRNVKLKD